LSIQNPEFREVFLIFGMSSIFSYYTIYLYKISSKSSDILQPAFQSSKSWKLNRTYKQFCT